MIATGIYKATGLQTDIAWLTGALLELATENSSKMKIMKTKQKKNRKEMTAREIC
jgi:hypothetical protein